MTPAATTPAEEAPTFIAPALDAVGFSLPRDRADATHLALPSAASPRLVLPLDHPRAAAAVLRRVGRPGGDARSVVRAAVVRTAAGLLARAGFPPAGGTRLVLSRDARSVAGRLAVALDLTDELVVACRTGPPRPNAKPVLQVLSSEGDVQAFVKVGVNDLTSTLVRREADALAHVAQLDLPGVAVPVVRAIMTVDGRPVVVTDPVVTTEGATRPAARVAALQAFARAPGTRSGPLGESSWAARLVRCAAETTHTGLRETITRFLETMGTTAVTLGLVHGDFTPWNIAASPHGIAVWDWERMMLDAPLGIDALHYELEGSRGEQVPWATQLDAAARRTKDEGTVPGEPAPVVSCYLMDQAARHLGAAVPLTAPHQAHMDVVLGELQRRLEAHAADGGPHA